MNNEIHINHITKRYGDVEALRDLSLEIGSGELFGLIAVPPLSAAWTW